MHALHPKDYKNIPHSPFPQEFKQEFGNVFEGHDGFAEGVIENKVNYLPPRDEYFIGVSDGNFYVADSDVLSKEKVCHKLYMAGTNK